MTNNFDYEKEKKLTYKGEALRKWRKIRDEERKESRRIQICMYNREYLKRKKNEI